MAQIQAIRFGVIVLITAIEAAFCEGKFLCAFFTREECKEYVKKELPDIDPFDIQLKNSIH
jgi:hypothetical protein